MHTSVGSLQSLPLITTEAVVSFCYFSNAGYFLTFFAVFPTFPSFYLVAISAFVPFFRSLLQPFLFVCLLFQLHVCMAFCAYCLICLGYSQLGFHSYCLCNLLQLLYHSDPVPASDHERCSSWPSWDWQDGDHQGSRQSSGDHGLCF